MDTFSKTGRFNVQGRTSSTMKEQHKNQSHSRSMLSYAVDLPNICTLVSLLCALLGIYFAVLKVYSASIIAMLWAVLFDWCDGMVARRMKGRSGELHALGSRSTPR
jgi:CDP-diacylglycerol--serine O-phosphatidyltransferase